MYKRQVVKLDYRKKDLTKFFSEYNSSVNSTQIIYNKAKKGDFFNLSLRPRVNTTSLSVKGPSSGFYDADFGKKSGFSFGVESEFVFPFNKNKWALLVEFDYQKFSGTSRYAVGHVSGGELLASIDYKYINIPLGVRHYFYLSEKSKIFANISYVASATLNSSMVLRKNDGSHFKTLWVEADANMAYGLGYKFNNKYSIEARVYTNRSVFNDSINSLYKNASIILGYTVF